MKTKKPAVTGPKPELFKIDGDWTAAIGKAISKPKPAEGWPTPIKKRTRRPNKKPA